MEGERESSGGLSGNFIEGRLGSTGYCCPRIIEIKDLQKQMTSVLQPSVG